VAVRHRSPHNARWLRVFPWFAAPPTIEKKDVLAAELPQ
jgi:hypothetical protein